MYYINEGNSTKRAKLTQNTPVVFVANLMVMTTFLGAGYSTTVKTIFSEYVSIKHHIT